MKNERLETLSDKVRRGQPIEFSEAMEVILYQEELRKEGTGLKQFLRRLFKLKK
jgi:hypothetical protein